MSLQHFVNVALAAPRHVMLCKLIVGKYPLLQVIFASTEGMAGECIWQLVAAGEV